MNNERDDAALIAEAAEMFPPDTVDVQSRYVIVHQLRASADIQDAQTKRETRWADTSDRACLMRKAADALDALLANWQPPAEPDRAEQAWFDAYDAYDVAGDSNAAASIIRAAMAEAAERPVIDVPEGVKYATDRLQERYSADDYVRIVRDFILSLIDGAGVRAKPVFSEEVIYAARQCLPEHSTSFVGILSRAILRVAGEK